MKLSNQAKGALLMALQKCLLEEVDMVGLLDEMDFSLSDRRTNSFEPSSN